MLALWPAPRTYTGQDVAEIHLVGATPLVNLVLAHCLGRGARHAEPGEFTLRAFLSGRIDLTRAEAVLGVIDASNPAQLDAALEQLAGGLSGPIVALRDRLLDVVAHLEANLDFTDEPDVDALGPGVAGRRARSIRSRAGRARPAAQTIAIGPKATRAWFWSVRRTSARAGSSTPSLGRDQAIVSPRAGTTRDYLAALCDCDGLTVELVDTAGIEPPRRLDRHPGPGVPRTRGRSCRPPARLSLTGNRRGSCAPIRPDLPAAGGLDQGRPGLAPVRKAWRSPADCHERLDRRRCQPAPLGDRRKGLRKTPMASFPGVPPPGVAPAWSEPGKRCDPPPYPCSWDAGMSSSPSTCIWRSKSSGESSGPSSPTTFSTASFAGSGLRSPRQHFESLHRDLSGPVVLALCLELLLQLQQDRRLGREHLRNGDAPRAPGQVLAPTPQSRSPEPARLTAAARWPRRLPSLSRSTA